MLIQALLAGSLFARAAVYQGPVVLAGVSRADSSRLRRSAESAQRSFAAMTPTKPRHPRIHPTSRNGVTR